MSGALGRYFKPLESKQVTAASAAENIQAELWGNRDLDATAASLQFVYEVNEFRLSNSRSSKIGIQQFVGQVEEQLDPGELHVLKKYAQCSSLLNLDGKNSASLSLLNADIPLHARLESTCDSWDKKTLTELKTAAIRENRPHFDPAQPGTKDDWYSSAAKLKREAENSKLKTVIYGDSITAAMDSDKRRFHAVFGKEAKNFGIPGDTAENLLWRLQQGEGKLKPDDLTQIIVEIGTNDLLHNKKPKQIASDALADANFLAEKFPKAKVLLLGLLPRGHYMNQVKEVNHYMRLDLQAAASKNLRFADIGPQMLKNGKMISGPSDTKNKEQLWQVGRVHPTPGPGYDRFLALIESRIKHQS